MNTNSHVSDQNIKKNLLIYAHYYHPDVASTGQLLKELAEGMLEVFNITVICVVPSYEGTIAPEYKMKKYYFENINGVKVIRVRVPEFGKTSKKSRVKNILIYFLRALAATFKSSKQDYVFSISQPPILGGLLGVWGKWVKHAKYIYNIQDFNPEQTIAIGYSKNSLILKLMMIFDKFSCKSANKIILVGQDASETLQKRFTGEKVPNYAFINNWIDEEKVYPLEITEPHVSAFREKYGLKDKFVIMYSGNLGLYYDLENIMRVIKRIAPGTKTSDGREVIFAFAGSGSIKDKLVLYKEKHHMDNVVFIPYQDKPNLIYSLNAANVHWCVSAKGIKGISVPSKLYGQIAVSRPVLGVLEEGTEARYIVDETKCGLVCEPGDDDRIEEHIKWFISHAEDSELKKIGSRGREYLVRNLAKNILITKYVKEIESCGRANVWAETIQR
jgi:glycosyltransferase involved in cell wall biosynthesis